MSTNSRKSLESSRSSCQQNGCAGFVNTALRAVPDSPPPADASLPTLCDEAMSTKYRQPLESSGYMCQQIVRAACVCTASNHTTGLAPTVRRQEFMDVGVKIVSGSPHRAAVAPGWTAAGSVSASPAGFEGGSSRASLIPCTARLRRRCREQTSSPLVGRHLPSMAPKNGLQRCLRSVEIGSRDMLLRGF